MKAELHSNPKEDHKGGNASQRIHPLRLLSTSTFDLKDGRLSIEYAQFSTYRCIIAH